MPWDLVRDGEFLLVEVDAIQDSECQALVDAVQAQVDDGVNAMSLVYDEEMNGRMQTVRDLLESANKRAVDVSVKVRPQITDPIESP